MEENKTGENLNEEKHNDIKIIRISKLFSTNRKNHENVMLISKGNKKIQYTLNNNLSPDNIFDSLKTIQNNQIYDMNENDLYHPSRLKKIKIKNQKKINDLKKISTHKNFFQKNKENSNQDIYNIYNINNIDIIPKEKNIKINTKKSNNNNFNKEKNESLRSLQNEGKSSNINSDINLYMNKSMFNFDKTNKNSIKINNKKHSVANIDKLKKFITINYNQINNNIAENNIDKISNLINIKNNELLYEIENENTNINYINKTKQYDKSCYICERVYIFPNIYYAKCKIHFFCKKCLKLYCHELITKGVKMIKCPIYKCQYYFDEIFLNKILDDHCYNILFENKEEIEKIDKKTNIFEISKPNILLKKYNQDKIDLYNHRKNVLDIDSNLALFKVRKANDEYCPNCHEHSIFKNPNSFFDKCLNCGNKICKHCNKEFTNFHMVMDDQNHCKVYFRKNKKFTPQSSVLVFIFQLLYTIGILIIFLVFFFIFFKNHLLLIFGIKEGNKNYFKIFFAYFFGLIILFIIFPIILIFIPYFPNIIALIDGF